MALPEHERLDLYSALMAARSRESSLAFDPELLAEIHRRSAQIDTGSVQPSPWSVVRKRVRERLEERSHTLIELARFA